MSLFSLFLPSSNSMRCLAKEKKKKCAFEGGDALEMLVSCTGLTSASPLLGPPLPQGYPACCNYPIFAYEWWIIHDAAGQAGDQCHWTHLDYLVTTIWTSRLRFSCNSPSTCPAHTPCRKCSAETSLTYRSVIMYLQGFIDLGYSDTLWVFKGWYAKRIWHCGYC